MRFVNIYVLLNDFDEIKYVGKTKHTLNKRLSEHINNRNTSKSYKNSWIIKLLKNGSTPKIKLIDKVDEKDWSFWEKYWISQFRTWGFRLTNMTDGGDGLFDITGKIGKKISSSKKKSKIVAWNKGKKMSKEFCDKISKLSKGRKASIETRKKISESNKGRVNNHSEKTKKKISNSLKEKYKNKEIIHPFLGKNHSEETKKKIKLSHLNKKLSEEHKLSLKKSAKRGRLHNNSKAIYQMDYENNIIKKYDCISDATRVFSNNNSGSISNCLNGRSKTAYKYKWEYV